MSSTSSKSKRPASGKRGAHIIGAEYSIKSQRLRKLAKAFPRKMRPTNEKEESDLLTLCDNIAHIVNAYARREARKAANAIGRS